MPTSSFKSAGRYELKDDRKNQPGPGAYQVNDAATINHLPGANPNNNPYPLRVDRFGYAVGDVDRQAMRATAEITGPGSYEPRVGPDGDSSSIAKRSSLKADRGWSAAYMSDSLRDMFTSFVRNDVTMAIFQGRQHGH